LLLLAPGPAAAHLVSTRFGELYSGMLHPVTTMQHLVPWLAIALLGALQTTATARWALLAFPAAVIFGLMLANLGVMVSYIDPLNIASFVLFGVLVVLKVPMPAIVFLPVVMLFGLSHGYANAAPDLAGFPAFLYATGVALAAYLIISLVSASAHELAERHDWGRIAVRAIGSWIAAAGLVYGAFTLATS
jgi:hydrogenase/urease accessory protein HupE